MTALEMGLSGKGTSGMSNVLQLMGLLVLFVVILIVTYYTTRFVGGIKLGQMRKGNFKVLETFRIAQNRYLQLVQIGKKYIVIAIGKNEIEFITELQENDLIRQEQSEKKDIKFLDVLTRIAGRREDNKEKDDRETDHE